MKCLICNKNYRHLGSHIWHKHKMYAIQYKEKFGLDHKFSLIDEDIKEKKRKSFWKNPTHIKNFKNGVKYQFKKGKVPVKGYYSAQSKKRVYIQLIKMNNRKKERCPVCNMIFKNVDSHLYMKHNLLRVKK